MNDVSPELEGLARFTIETTWKDLPEPVIKDTKLFLLDSIGCALAGVATDPGKMIIALAKRLGGPLESSIIGVNGKVGCTNAALANGQLINALDYEALSGHAAPYIVPATLAIAESTEASGKDLILATAAGLEISARISGALARGFSFSGPDLQLHWANRSGYAHLNFGVAAGVGKLLKLDQEQMLNALGTAGHLAQVLTWIRDTYQEPRGMTKYGVPGWQNTGGIMAALLAEMGFIGDKTIFDSKEGFWKFAGYDGWNPEKILDGLGETWSFFTKILFKPYPSCRQFQTELDLFLKIIEKNNLKPEEIESIKILGHPTLDMPAFTSREIKHVVDIQFGPAYTFAMAAQGIPVGADWQDLEMARSPKVVELAKKVDYRGYADFGKKQISIVEVAARGQTFREEKPFSQLHEMQEADLVAKYKHNAGKALTEKKIGDSLNALQKLENIKNVSELAAQIT